MSSRTLLVLTLIWMVLTSCQEQGVRAFWKTHSIDYTDIQAAEDQFALFAEQAVAAPEKEAEAALDGLCKQLKKDTVAYYIYASWMESAFYNLLSPCRHPQLFSKAVDRMAADGLLTPDVCAEYRQKQQWALTNRPGQPAVVPDGPLAGTRTLVLVIDRSCSSCREALETMGPAPEWEGVRKVAVCCGRGPQPATPGWEYVAQDPENPVFDPHMTPIYFVVAADGTVETPYTLVFHE